MAEGHDRDPDDVGEDVARFESTQRLDPDAFNHAKSRLDGGYECAVAALLTDADGRVLLVCEDGRWSLPGGEVGGDQSREAALRDAVAATTGLELTVGRLVAVNDVTLTDGDREASLAFEIYDGEIAAGEPEPTRASVTAAAWHDEVPAATVDRDVIDELR